MQIKRLTDEQREKAAEHFRLAKWWTKQAMRSHPNLMRKINLKSVAHLGLCYAARSYNPSISKFSAYAKIAMNTVLKDELIDMASRNQECRRILNFTDMERLMLPPNEIEDKPPATENIDAFLNLISHATPASQEALTLKFYYGLDDTRAGKILGIRRQSVRTRITTGLNMIRKAIESEPATRS